MNMLNIDFSIIGVTETWLNDVTYNLYGLGGRDLLDKLRRNDIGGGVSHVIKHVLLLC